MHANNMELSFPNQLFINNEFIDASNGGTFNTINPTDESVICKVAKATKDDVDYAVHCAKVGIYILDIFGLQSRLTYRPFTQKGHSLCYCSGTEARKAALTQT